MLDDGAAKAGCTPPIRARVHGANGVLTFIVNQDGVVLQKDPGEDTATIIETMQHFDLDSRLRARGLQLSHGCRGCTDCGGACARDLL